jgi:hypothetical protein
MFRLSWSHHQEIQSANLKLLSRDYDMAPYITSIHIKITTQSFMICRLNRLMMAPREQKLVATLYFDSIKTQLKRQNASELF